MPGEPRVPGEDDHGGVAAGEQHGRSDPFDNDHLFESGWGEEEGGAPAAAAAPDREDLHGQLGGYHDELAGADHEPLEEISRSRWIAETLRDLCTHGSEEDIERTFKESNYFENYADAKRFFADEGNLDVFVRDLERMSQSDKDNDRNDWDYLNAMAYEHYLRSCHRAAMDDDGAYARALGDGDDNVDENGFVKTAGIRFPIYNPYSKRPIYAGISYTIRVDELNKEQYVASRQFGWNAKANEMTQVCAVMVEERDQGRLHNADGSPKTVLIGYKESSWFGNQMSGSLMERFRRYWLGKLPGAYARGAIKAIHMLNAQCITASYPTKTSEDPNGYIRRTRENAKRLFQQSIGKFKKSGYTEEGINPIKGNEPYLAFLINERQKQHIEAFYQRAQDAGHQPPIVPTPEDMRAINNAALLELQNDIRAQNGEFKDDIYVKLGPHELNDLLEGVGRYWEENQFHPDSRLDRHPGARPEVDDVDDRGPATPNPVYEEHGAALPGGGGGGDHYDEDDSDVEEDDAAGPPISGPEQ